MKVAILILFSLLSVGCTSRPISEDSIGSPSVLWPVGIEEVWREELVRKCLVSTVVLYAGYDDGYSMGSGVLVSKDGKVLSAAHVFTHGDVERITMITLSGQEYDMQLVALDRRSDLALLLPIRSAQDFPFSPLRQIDSAYAGQSILVVGHPYENLWAVSTGIISRIPFHLYYLTKVYDITALINPGNSGGPVFNRRGEVIGIVSAMRVTMMRDPIGIGIAITTASIQKFLRSHEREVANAGQVKRYKIGALR